MVATTGNVRVIDNVLSFPFHFYFIFSLFSMLRNLGAGYSVTLQSHDGSHRSYDIITVMWLLWKNVEGSSTMMLYSIFNTC